MTDYTFCSSDPEHFNEVDCPVNYLGVSRQLKWYVSSINTYFSVEMFTPDDFITIECEDAYYKINLSKSYKDRDNSGLLEDLNVLLSNEIDGMTIIPDELSRQAFIHTKPFSITGMSYNLKQALGFFYVKQFPLHSVLANQSYEIRAKAIGYSNLTPIWYLLSNLGSPNVINSMDNPWVMLYPSIAMKIQNSFTIDQPIQYANGDFMSVSQASALSNLRVKLVDINLNPVKLLTPLIVTISFYEVPDQNAAEIEEAMATMETDPNFIKSREERMKTNYRNLIDNSNKVLEGIDTDPPHLAYPVEANPREMEQALLEKHVEIEAEAQRKDIHEIVDDQQT